MARKSNELRGLINQDKEDRISDLPDSILCHILSYLPTKSAVATSILSSRWKLVWTSLSDLCFDDRLCKEYASTTDLTNNASTMFENFVNRVFNLSHPLDINKFSLYSVSLRHLSCLNFWVSNVIMRNVRVIELVLHNLNSVDLPESICNSKTLEVLKLNLNFVIKIPPSGICFPSVKVLHVVMYNPDNSMTERLFSVCPVLEDLTIKVCFDEVDQLIKFNISSRTLKRLTLVFEKLVLTNHEHQVTIKAPNLEYLRIHGDTLISYTMHELHSLNDVFIDIVDEEEEEIHADRALQLLNAVAKAKSLFLSASTLCALDNAYENFFPTFPNLTCLKVELGECGCQLLPVILNSLPNLEVFIFEKEIGSSDVFVEFQWDELQSVPPCSLFHVKKIEVRGFGGDKDELELVKYFLKNGEVLKTMVVKSRKLSSHEKLKLCQKLLVFERGSKACQIEFL